MPLDFIPRSGATCSSVNELDVPFLMRKIVKPVEMVKTELVYAPYPFDEGTFYFDLEKGDWVLPGRKGVVADLGVEYSYRDSEGRTESRAKITFCQAAHISGRKSIHQALNLSTAPIQMKFTKQHSYTHCHLIRRGAAIAF